MYVYIILSALFLLSINCLLYIIPILFIRHFRSPNNILTTYLCLTIFICSIYHIIYFLLFVYGENIFHNRSHCRFIEYIRVVTICQIDSSFLATSIYRYTSLIFYWKPFFKRKQWLFICISIQSILAILLPLPIWLKHDPECVLSNFINMYSLIIVSIVPLVLYLFLNIRILHYVYTSPRRITPQTISLPIDTRRDNASPHGIRLLIHSMCMFLLYIVGWTPYFITMIVVSSYFNRLRLTEYFIPWILFTQYGIIFSLFVYNKKLRDFLRNKFVAHCRFCCI